MSGSVDGKLLRGDIKVGLWGILLNWPNRILITGRPRVKGEDLDQVFRVGGFSLN